MQSVADEDHTSDSDGYGSSRTFNTTNTVEAPLNDHIHVKSLLRPISPPALKRKRPIASLSLTEDHVIHRIVQRDRRKIYYFKISRESELAIRTSKPGKYLERQGASTIPLPRSLGPKKQQTLREALISLEPNSGGFVMVDYSQLDAENHDNQTNTPSGDNANPTEAEQKAAEQLGSHVLCSCCEYIVSSSQVLNRQWREEQGGGDGIMQSIQVPFTGRKCNVFKHHRRLGALRQSAESGCHLCALLDSFDPKDPFRYDATDSTSYDVRVIYAEMHNEGPGVIVIQPKGLPSKATYLMHGESPYKVAPTLVYPRTDAEPVLDLARRWLKTCLTKHKACTAHSAGASDFVPTRLVKVQASNGSVQSIKLVLGSKLPLETPYLTLSHCWGGAKIVRLLLETLEDFQNDIPLSSLPKNFTDAVLVTALLGHEYIWIDSLCIIQDSASDWRDEAARMGSVYRYSVLTIAAMGSKDSHGGCFVNRSALSFTPCQLISPGKNRPGVYAENWHSQPTPLHTRAWVVQERCLSVRTLNFGAEMISWDCVVTNASEEHPQMVEYVGNASVKQAFFDLLPDPLTDLKLPRLEWTRAWCQLVREYSSCDLSFQSDKWTAMKGLATEVEKGRGDRLIHGLWQRDFVDELLWKVVQPKKTRLDIGEPSWSWLSIQGKINKERYEYSGEFRIDATVNIPPFSDSETTPCEIEITARMLPLRWVLTTTKDKDKDSTPAYNFRLLDGRPDGPDSGPWKWFGKWTPDTIPEERAEMWSLQLVTADENELKTRVGLVVVCVDKERGFWRRVGFYEFAWRDGSHVVDGGVGKRWFGERRCVVLV